VLTVTTAALQSITVTPADPSIAKGLTQQFTATGNYSDKTTQDLTGQVTWASATTSVATISTTGLATTVGTGTTSISATLGSISGSTVLTVTAAALQSITLTPANPTIAKGTTQQFTATGNYSDKTTLDLTSQVTWASATTSVATVSTTGLATAVGTGTSSISATLGSISGSTVLTVTTAALQSITVTPADPSIAKGLTQQFTAAGNYSDKTTQDLTGQVTWASATTSVATISTTGLATAVGTGTTSISATLGSISGSTVLTVTAAALQSITVTPANPSISKGSTQQFTATGTYTDNTTQDLTSQVTWASATTSVATISAAGLAAAVATGTSTISAMLNGITGTTVLTVALPQLSPTAVKDDSQGGYYEYGVWTVASGGYLGNHAVANPATSSTASSRWTLTVPAATYDFYTTWVSASANATNTGYSLYDGFKKLGTVTANQQLAPADGSYGGVAWAKLGTYTVTNGKITVAMSAVGANGDIVADAILLVPASTGGAARSSASTVPGSVPAPSAVMLEPILPPASLAPDPGAAAPEPATPVTAQVNAPSQATTTLAMVPVTGIDENVPVTGSETGTLAPAKAQNQISLVAKSGKTKPRRSIHERLIERLARERISDARQEFEKGIKR
jgi:hypothetical protein